MKTTRFKRISKVAAASVTAVAVVVVLAMVLTGCGTTTNAINRAGEQAVESQPAVTGETGVSSQPPATTAPSVAPTGQSAAVDCPFYDNGTCSRTGEACTDCRN